MSALITRRGGIAGATTLAMIGRRASAQNKRDMTIGLASSSFATVAARIAGEMGFFAKYGVNPKFIIMDSASAATTALISRSVDACVAGPGEMIVAQAHGQKVVALAYTFRGLSGSLVLGKATVAKLGVSPQAPVKERLKALDGLVIAAQGKTGANAVSFRAASKWADVNIRFAYMGMAAMIPALQSGAVQGYNAGAPYWAIPVAKGFGVLWISGPRGDLPPEFAPISTGTFQVVRDFADANPALVKGVKAAFADLTKALDERPADVKAVVGKLYPALEPATLDLLFEAESAAWKSVPPTQAELEHEIDFVKAAGDQIPGIDAVRPDALFYRGG